MEKYIEKVYEVTTHDSFAVISIELEKLCIRSTSSTAVE